MMRRIARHVLLLPPIILIGGMGWYVATGINVFAGDNFRWVVLGWLSSICIPVWGLTE